jgi:hypothetical protein
LFIGDVIVMELSEIHMYEDFRNYGFPENQNTLRDRASMERERERKRVV